MRSLFFILLSACSIGLFSQVSQIINGCAYRNNVSFVGSCYETTYDDYALILYDEFDNDSINYDLWEYTTLTSNGACDANAKTYFTKRANVKTQNGKLNLYLKQEPATLPCITWDINPNYINYEYSGGWLESTMQYGYGKFEISFKVSQINNTNPAFWLYGQCQNEIDVFEFMDYSSGIQNRVKQGMFSSGGYCEDYYDDYNAPRCHLEQNYDLPNAPSFSQGFHRATMEWTPNRILWLIDGIETLRLTSYHDNLTGQRWECSTSSPNVLHRLLSYPNYDMFLNTVDPHFNALRVIFDIGQFGGVPTLPAVLEIEYVKIWSPIICNQTLNLNGGVGNPESSVAKNDWVAGNINCSTNANGLQILNMVANWRQNHINLVASNEIAFFPGFLCEKGAYMSANISPCDGDKTNRMRSSDSSSVVEINFDDFNKPKVKDSKENILRRYLPFPNPTSDTFKILNLKDFLNSKVEVYNFFGARLFSFDVITGEETIDLTNQPNGLYTVKIDGLKYSLHISKIK